VFRLHCSATDIDRGSVDFRDIQEIERDAGAHDIGDRIDGPDFMEVNFFNRYAVDPGFGLAQPEKDGGSCGLGASGDGGAIDHLQDMFQMAVFGGSGVRMHAKFRRGDSAAGGLLDLVARAGFQAVKSVEERVGGSPGVEQSTDSHVAADPGKGVEVADLHGADYAPPPTRPRFSRMTVLGFTFLSTTTLKNGNIISSHDMSP